MFIVDDLSPSLFPIDPNEKSNIINEIRNYENSREDELVKLVAHSHKEKSYLFGEENFSKSW